MGEYRRDDLGCENLAYVADLAFLVSGRNSLRILPPGCSPAVDAVSQILWFFVMGQHRIHDPAVRLRPSTVFFCEQIKPSTIGYVLGLTITPSVIKVLRHSSAPASAEIR
jgi:hypothetical protein